MTFFERESKLVMKNKSKSVYSKKDLETAYYRGLEAAIIVLEKTMDLSKPGRQKLLEKLKRILLNDRIKNISDNFF